MAELLTAAQMRAIEGAAIESGAVTGLELMERAGAGVVQAIFREWPDLEDSRGGAVILCGPGNNGGDGFVIARLLKDRGLAVDVYLLGDADKLPPDARTNYDRWVKKGNCSPLSEHCLGTGANLPGLVVDALFGTGLTRAVTGVAGELLDRFATLRQKFGTRCVSVDIPSGVCSDSGKALGCVPEVDLTVSFHAEKLGHRLNQADDLSRQVVVADIGLPHMAKDDKSELVWMVEGPCKRDMSKRTGGQKYTHGHALVLAGGAGQTGAARLAARGALRIGAGLVTLGVQSGSAGEVASQITAIMMKQVDDSEALSALLQDSRLNALCLGPGLGVDARTRGLVSVALRINRAVVLDADALTSFSADPSGLFEILHEKAVLTPHGGEFSRLFPDIAEELAASPNTGPAFSKVDATRAAAQRAGCAVLFKGADTVIAMPDGRCSVHSAHYDRAAPWLATAGSGDVLAGFITGLMARGMETLRACEIAAWLHTQCALEFGPGLIAEDIPEKLPDVFRGLKSQAAV